MLVRAAYLGQPHNHIHHLRILGEDIDHEDFFWSEDFIDPDSPDPALIEAVAESLWNAEAGAELDDMPWNQAPLFLQDNWRKMAHGAIRAITTFKSP